MIIKNIIINFLLYLKKNKVNIIYFNNTTNNIFLNLYKYNFIYIYKYFNILISFFILIYKINLFNKLYLNLDFIYMMYFIKYNYIIFKSTLKSFKIKAYKKKQFMLLNILIFKIFNKLIILNIKYIKIILKNNFKYKNKIINICFNLIKNYNIFILSLINIW